MLVVVAPVVSGLLRKVQVHQEDDEAGRKDDRPPEHTTLEHVKKIRHRLNPVSFGVIFDSGLRYLEPIFPGVQG